ncbi:MAG TPA: FHA domain-containing protein [Bryobacteraceae bacterium]|nr:FHA domain-containing protein [Bryobacteraceae bacterium]
MADKMVRCPQGHFFDPSKHSACPWCALPADAEMGGGAKTMPVRPGAMEALGSAGLAPGPGAAPPPLPGGPPPLAMPAPAAGPAPGGPPAPATRRLGQDTGGHGKHDPVVGWLVCLDGPDRGRDFRLHTEKNFIGRSPLMDVCVPSDETVSREKHGVVIFDPKKQVFWVLPGDSSGLVYLNGEIVHSPAQMKRDDILEIGQTKLVLIPFCGDQYSWTPAGA